MRTAAAVLAAYLWFCRRTSRVVWLRPPPQVWGKTPVVLASWHGRLWACGLARPPNGVTRCLVSSHRDGRLMGAIAAWLGVQPVIGASRVGRRGAAQTLAAWRVLVETLEGGGNVVIAADGPLGPGRRARPGAVRLARTGGVPLLPCAMSARRGFELSTWDHLFVPLPFSTIYLVVGEPLVANSLTPLTLALEEAQRAVDVAAGRAHDAIKA